VTRSFHRFALAGQPDRFFARIPSARIVFTLGRDRVLAARQGGGTHNDFIHPPPEIDAEAA